MTLISFLLLLIIAAICGAIGQSIAGYNLGGCIISIVVGFIGAWLGLWIVNEFGLPKIWPVKIGERTFPIFWSIIGATLFSSIIGLVGRAMKDD